MSFEELREKYPTFIYENYHIDDNNDEYVFTFDFCIPNLTAFHPTLKISKKKLRQDINQDLLKYLVFHIGLIELISYYKCTCSPNVEIKAGYINEEQINWFKKLYYYGLGEFMYVNHIECSLDDLMHITCSHNKEELEHIDYVGQGNLIAIGGGKDSIVSLNILKGLDNTGFIINPKEPSLKCMEISGLDYLEVKRTLDPTLLELNKKDYLNGHTPFSSLVAFISYLCAYLMGKQYIILSNEASANEPTVLGTKINHQYSKTYEFENDFNNYTNKYFKININYFSLLRCLSEFQIGMLFSQYKEYHSIFKSCNVGSKSIPWTWCCNCPKCLFVYIILSPFLTKEELINIFKEDLYNKKDLLDTFIELLGYSKTKPFECVGTYSEVRYAVSLVINKYQELPYLLEYYKEHYPLELDNDLRKTFNNEHNIPNDFVNLVKKELDRVNGLIDND